MASTPDPSKGRHDFDFLHGNWKVENHRLADPLDPSGSEWLKFAAMVKVRPILAGLGNIDIYQALDFPGRPGFEALTLRLFDSEAGVWRIWWASTAGGGQLDTPVGGRFTGGHGVFECDDIINEHEVKVRYEWLQGTQSAPRWQQSFSLDGGQSWRTNWKMNRHRRPIGK